MRPIVRIFAAFAAAFLLVSDDAQGADDLYRKGYAAFQQGDYANACIQLKLYLAANPPKVAGNPDFRKRIEKAITQAVDHINWTFQDHRQVKQELNRCRTGGQHATITRGLTIDPNLPATPPAPTASLSTKRREMLGRLVGTYKGSNDGRRVKLTIQKSQRSGWSLLITLEDLDRGVVFRGTHNPVPTTDLAAHVLRDVRLPRRGGGGMKEFSMLLLHTWNDRHLTGITRWSGQEFGASFERAN